VRHALEELDLKLWSGLHADDPEQDSIRYDWQTGGRLVDLESLFTNIVAGKIRDAANGGGNYQTPFCEPHGRALVDGYSPVMDLPPLPTSTVTVDVDPRGAVGDLQSVNLRSQLIAAICRMPSKNLPLKLPTTLKFPLYDRINAACRLLPKSTWATVNVPLEQRLGSADAELVFQLRQPPPASPSVGDGSDEINIVVDPGPGGGPLPPEIARQLAPNGRIGGAKLPPGAVYRKDANGPTITFSRNDSRSILDGSRLAVDWLRTLRRTSPSNGGHIVLSPVGFPKDVRPNVHFEFGKSDAATLGGFLENDACVTLDGYSDEMPVRRMSLLELEDHPLEWLAPGQYRIAIDLPWGRWTTRFRVGDKPVTVALPQNIGLEPLRNQYRHGDLEGAELIKTDEYVDVAMMPIAVKTKGSFGFWAVPATGVPIVAVTTETGMRAEFYSETTLREWDELLTVGRLNVADPAGLVKRLGGKIPDGASLDFAMLAVAAAYAEYNRRNLSAVRTIVEMLDEQSLRFRDVRLLRLAVDVAEGRLVGNERQHAIMLEVVPLFPRFPAFRWGVSLLTDLARQAELPLPRWIEGLDPSSPLTLVNIERLPRLGLPPALFGDDVPGRQVRVLPGPGQRHDEPSYVHVIWRTGMADRLRQREVEWAALQKMIESEKPEDGVENQRLLLEHLVEEEDAETENGPTPEADPA
jgi:hypothetical protein